jgi:hypothetical protein
MTISAAARPTPIPAPNALVALVNSDGKLSQAGLQMLEQWRNYSLGTSRLIPCECNFAANVYTLTPRAPACVIEKYCDYDGFAFVASDTSTGNVTALVQTTDGSLAALKVFKANGSAQAGSGDVVTSQFYIAYFVDVLDGSGGGFVLK